MPEILVLGSGGRGLPWFQDQPGLYSQTLSQNPKPGQNLKPSVFMVQWLIPTTAEKGYERQGQEKEGRKGGREEFLLVFMLSFLFQLLYYYRITFLSKIQFCGQSHQS